MMKLHKMTSLLIAAVVLFSISGCGASEDTNTTNKIQANKTEGIIGRHECVYSDAKCLVPAKCMCGKTNGSALGHDWVEATCSEARTCSRCNISEGDALGHNWTEVSCLVQKKCSRCGEKGEYGEHAWGVATTSEPKKCKTCGIASGSKLKLPTPLFEKSKHIAYIRNDIRGFYKNQADKDRDYAIWLGEGGNCVDFTIEITEITEDTIRGRYSLVPTDYSGYGSIEETVSGEFCCNYNRENGYFCFEVRVGLLSHHYSSLSGIEGACYIQTDVLISVFYDCEGRNWGDVECTRIKYYLPPNAIEIY